MAGPTGNEGNHTIDGLTVRGGLAIEGARGVLTYLNGDTASATARDQILRRGSGYYAENYPYRSGQAGTIAVSGTIYFMSLALLAGDVVSNFLVQVTAAGSGFSGVGCKAGLYTATSATAGSLLTGSTTGDVSGQLGATGVKSLPLTTPYTVPTDGVYYAAFIQIGTPAQFLRGGSGLVATIGGVQVFGTQSGQTDLVASATIANTSNIAYWVGIS